MNHLITSWDIAIDRLLQGGIGVVPTDTVYGLVACAKNRQAVERLYAIKYRSHKPGTLAAASTEELLVLGFPEKNLAQVKHFWPGQLSAVLPLEGTFAYLHQGLGDLAVRIPDNPEFLAILQRTGPLQTTSANSPGAPVSTTIQEAIDYFGDAVDFYVNGGNLSGRLPSTVVRVAADNTLTLLRAGAVDISRLQE
jgi:L-threonylcarbamoyladenylate synthase